MKELLLILCPLLGAAIAFAWPSNRTRPWLLPAVGAVQTVLALWLLVSPPEEAIFAWVRFDSLARAVLPMVALLFLACSAYGVAYLRLREERGNRVFVAALLALLGLISLAHQAQHLGLLWVAVETATLITVPLLHFNGTARAFEATWKYLLVGGTGIALSLLGSFCLGYASLHGGSNGDLTFAALAAQGGQLSRHWVLTAWVLLLVGYGTKMGLAPMHTWKPDAYGEAPGIVGALLAGGMTTTAFIALLRVRQVVDAAGAGGIAGQTMLALGLFSMVVAALFLLGTPDFKRMLAYSSVEHMGILSVGAAMGSAGVAAALFHVWTNGLTKGALFLSAGNLRRAAGGRSRDEVAGMALRSPVSARIFVVGLLAVTACPPFGPFFSELRVVRTAFETSHGMAAAGFLSCMLFAFFGMSRLVFAIVDGRPRRAACATGNRFRETAGVLVPPLVLLGCSLWLGLATPTVLSEAWKGAAAELCPKVAKGEGAEIRNPKSEVRKKSETRIPKSENGGAVSVGGAPASGPARTTALNRRGAARRTRIQWGKTNRPQRREERREGKKSHLLCVLRGSAVCPESPRTLSLSTSREFLVWPAHELAGPEAGAPGRQLRSQLARSGFEFRVSGFGFPSDFGFRISDFTSTAVPTTP